MFRSPQSQNIRVAKILQPFQNCIWYLFIMMLGIFVFALAVTFRLDGEDLSMRYSNSFLIVIGCICQQGVHRVTLLMCHNNATYSTFSLIYSPGNFFQLYNMSTRIVFLSAMIFSLVMYNYYSASVVSARLSESIVKINDSLDSLAATKLGFASEPMIYFEFLMKVEMKYNSSSRAIFHNIFLTLRITLSPRYSREPSGTLCPRLTDLCIPIKACY